MPTKSNARRLDPGPHQTLTSSPHGARLPKTLDTLAAQALAKNLDKGSTGRLYVMTSAGTAGTGSAEVSVYVHAAARGRGVGLALLRAVIDAAPNAGISHLLARIESSGLASLRLHAAAGFERVGTLHRVGEKFGRVLDVVFMEKLLEGPS